MAFLLSNRTLTKTLVKALHNYSTSYAIPEGHQLCFLECDPKFSSEMCGQQKQEDGRMKGKAACKNFIFILQGTHVTKLVEF